VDGAVVSRAGGAVRTLAPGEAAAVHERVRARTAALAALASGEPWPFEGSVDRQELLARLGAASRWDAAEHGREALRFDAAYPERVPILPPDRYRDVVVQPATGCPAARCAFCAFYRDAPFAPLSPARFDAHLEAVRSLFGRALPGRTGIFLGSASALSLPQPSLLAAMARAGAVLGEMPRGIAAFADPDHAPSRSAAAYRELRSAGMSAVLVGLETGWPDLRRRLGKRSDLGPLRAMVGGLKEAGVPCAISILAGIAAEDPERHARDTAGVVAELALGPGDIVYVSPLDASPGPHAAREVSLLREALRGRTAARVAPYRVDLFRYYA
jgi:radical SAM superfamily enzyme YgiQ (UPF0313 family)